MATGKPKSGAGPYAGYKKNYATIKSSKGTKAEKVVGKVIAAAGGGLKPQKVKVAGKTMTTKPTEAGLGVVGAMAKAAARTAARNTAKGRMFSATETKYVAGKDDSITKRLIGNGKVTAAKQIKMREKVESPGAKRRIGSVGKERAREKATGAQGTKYAVKTYSKGDRDSVIATKRKPVSPTSDQFKSSVRPYSQPLIGMTGKVPVKGRTSPIKRKK